MPTTPTIPTTLPTHDQLLRAWIDTGGNPAALLDTLNVEPTDLFALLADPAIQAHLDTYEKLLARHARIRALAHQNNASTCIASSLSHADPAQRLRSATTLARIAHQTQSAARHMLRPSSPGPTGGGGRVREAGGGKAGDEAVNRVPRPICAARSDVPINHMSPNQNPSHPTHEPQPASP